MVKDMKHYILHLLQLAIGKENAVSKKEICNKTNCDERTVRNYINQLRKDGYMILSNSKGSGYYMCSNIDEAKAYVCEMRKRAAECTFLADIAEHWIESNNQIIDAEVIIKSE